MSKVILFSGPPAAGKSTALDATQSNGYYTIQMEDVARDRYEKSDTSVSFSEWAEIQREANGKLWIIKAVMEEVPVMQNRVAVEGVRNPVEIEYIEDLFNDVYTVVLWASQWERYQRVFDLDEGGCDNFGQFLERDLREIELGIDKIIKRDMDDEFIRTDNYEEYDLKDEMSRIVESFDWVNE